MILSASLGFVGLPVSARAHGDPASDYLVTQSIFLPFTTKVDQDEVTRLAAVLRAAGRKHLQIRVAVIVSPADLGPAFLLYGKPQHYAAFLGLEISSVYRDALLVVMPNGYGYAVEGQPDPKASRVLKALPAPGRDATKAVVAATAGVRALALASGYRLVLPKGGSSTTRDRITIAAAATAGIALIAAIVLYRRQRRSTPA